MRRRLAGLADPAVRPLIEKIGRNAKALMARKADIGVRYYSDFFAPKLPSAKKTKNMGNGPTSFHQDYITFAVDRSGGMTFWIPLEAYGPEAGTMSFLNKSHRLGVLGNYTSYGGQRHTRRISRIARLRGEPANQLCAWRHYRA